MLSEGFFFKIFFLLNIVYFYSARITSVLNDINYKKLLSVYSKVCILVC